jgi:branched-chain amino acid transport system permease protein
LAFVAGILVAAGLGLVFQLAFVMRFFNAPRIVLTVLTIAAIPALQFSAGLVTSLPIFPPVEDRPVEALLGAVEVPFASWGFYLGDFRLRFGFGHVFAIGVTIAALTGLAAFLRFTRLGTAIRAAAENSDRARMLGISTSKLSMVVWALGGALGGLGVILTGTIHGRFSPGAVPPELIIVPLAAAVLARFENLPLAVAAALLLTVAREAVVVASATQVGLVDVSLFVVVLLGLLAHRRRRGGRSEEAEATSFEALQEHRPIPNELLQLPSVSLTRRILIGIGLVALVVFPLAATPAQTNRAGYFVIVGLVILSLVVLTGWTGQVSLGQFAIVAVAAVVGGAMTSRWHISFWFALILVPIFMAAFTTLIGIPALRIRGLFLAVVTFAFALGVQAVLFEERWFGWILPEAVDRPTLFLLDFEDNRSMYFLVLVVFFLAVLLVTVLRRTRTGRLLIATRENENNLRSFGVNPVRIRLAGFAISGFICGLAGVLLAHHARSVTRNDFTVELSLFAFLDAVVGGVGSVVGAMLGTGYFALAQSITGTLGALVPVLTLGILYVSPGGLSALAVAARDGVLKIVAQRRQMVVPSLYADMDAEALRRRLIPLAEAIPNSGLGALPYDQRYAAASDLYGSRGVLTSDGEPAREDAAVLGAAARSFGADEQGRVDRADERETGRGARRRRCHERRAAAPRDVVLRARTGRLPPHVARGESVPADRAHAVRVPADPGADDRRRAHDAQHRRSRARLS